MLKNTPAVHLKYCGSQPFNKNLIQQGDTLIYTPKDTIYMCVGKAEYKGLSFIAYWQKELNWLFFRKADEFDKFLMVSNEDSEHPQEIHFSDVLNPESAIIKVNGSWIDATYDHNALVSGHTVDIQTSAIAGKE